MCNPVAVMAVAGGASAVFGHIAQVQATNAANKEKLRIFKRQQSEVIGAHDRNLSLYYTRGVDAQISAADRVRDANAAANKEQLLLNESVALALKKSEERQIKGISNKRLGKAAERGVRRRAAITSASARDISGFISKYDQQRDRFAYSVDSIYRLKDQKDREIRNFVGLAPVRGREPMKPQFSKGPSLFSLAAGVTMGALQGASMGQSLKAPPVNGGGSGFTGSTGFDVSSLPSYPSAYTYNPGYSTSDYLSGGIITP